MNNYHSDFKHFIEGNRIYLREVRLSDVTEHYCRWMNDPDVVQFLETRFFSHSRRKIESYVREMQENPDCVFLAVILKKRDVHIGNIKIGPINRFHHFAEISLIIGEKTCWGKGYGTEAIELAATYAFNELDLNKLSAGFYANNVGSIKAFKKVGFFEEGLRKKHRLYKGDYVDEVLMGLPCAQ